MFDPPPPANPMRIPPRGDPLRPLRLATNALRVLGVVCLAFGTLGSCCSVIIGDRIPGEVLLIVLGAIIISYFLPGGLYLWLAGAVFRRKRWALITALVIVSVHLALIALSIVANLIMHRDDPVSLGIAGILGLIMALTILYLAQSFGALQALGDGAPRGFEPIMGSDSTVYYPPSYPLPPSSLKQSPPRDPNA